MLDETQPDLERYSGGELRDFVLKWFDPLFDLTVFIAFVGIVLSSLKMMMDGHSLLGVGILLSGSLTLLLASGLVYLLAGIFKNSERLVALASSGEAKARSETPPNP